MRRVLRFEVPYKAPNGVYPPRVETQTDGLIVAAGIYPPDPDERGRNPRVMIWVDGDHGPDRMRPRRLYHVLTGDVVPIPDRFVATAVGVDAGGVPYVAHVFEALYL